MLTALVCLSLSMMQPPASPNPDAVDWIKAHSFAFDTVEAGGSLKDLEPLRKMIGDARIVSLGEPTHGTREAFQMKHRLLEFLATEMGFTIFSIEASMPESYRLNDYVLKGVGNPEELIGGMYFWTWNTQEVLAMVKWMREFNAAGKGPVQFTGFDMQFPQVAGENALSYLKAHAPELAMEWTPIAADAGRIQAAPYGATFGVVTGTVPADAAAGKKLVYSGWIRTKDLKNGRAGLWWRCDLADGSVGAFDNMQDRGPTGTSEWTRYEIAFEVPKDTKNINFGVLMPGEGEAWFDGLEIRLDDQAYAPADLDLDFEAEDFKGFYTPSAGYAYTKDADAKSGKRSAKLASSAKEEPPKADASEVRGRVEAFVVKFQAARDELAKKGGAKETDWAIQNARIVGQYAKMMQAMKEPALGNVRDDSMAANVKWILDQNPGAKIVLWAHNGHVSKGAIWGQRWMGTELDKMYPGQMVVMGFTTGKGEYRAIASGKGGLSTHKLAAPPPGSVEWHLAALGQPRLIFDPRGAVPNDPATAWLLTSAPIRSIGAMSMEQQFFPHVPKASWDLIVHIEETTPSRMIGQQAAGKDGN
jgi:erythromycin esterase-like protein